MKPQPVKSVRLQTNAPLCCPECNSDATGATGQGFPREGDISICMYCQAINKFTGKGMGLQLTKIPQSELDHIKECHPEEWKKIWEYIYTVKEIMYNKTQSKQ